MNPILGQALDVLFDPGRASRNGHFAVGDLFHRISERGAGHVSIGQRLNDVELIRIDGQGHLIRLRCQLRQHVAGIIGQPLGDLALRLGGE
ncbi:hypothetical protein D3C76_1583100 [compost metagenome]